MIWSIVGTLLGALPGFHPNLAVSFLKGRELFEVVFASLFTSVIPASLFVPTSEMSALLLPGQEAVKKGKLQESINEFAGGALMGSALFLLISPIYRYLAYVPFQKITLHFLLITTVVVIFRSKSALKSALVFLLSGIYGFFILNLPVDTNQVLGVHFASMFGIASLLVSDKLPTQKLTSPRIVLDFTPSFVGTMGGLLISLFPAITPAQVYAILVFLFGSSAKGIVAAGAMTTSSFLFSFLSYLFFGKGRMATVETIQYLPYDFFFIAIFVYLLTLVLSEPLIQFINKVPNLKWASLLTISAVMLAAYPQALWLAPFSLLLGFIPFWLGVERVHLMGSLLLPTILWYAGWR